MPGGRARRVVEHGLGARMTPPLEIHVKKGPSFGTVLPLAGLSSVTIGRAPTNTLVLKDEKVSSHHARMDVAQGGVIVTDLGSKNGTFAGGESVVGSRLVGPGTEVAMGGRGLELPPAQEPAHMGATRAGPATGAAPRPAPPRPPPSPPLRPAAAIRSPSEPARDLILAPAAHPGQRNLTKAQRNLAVLAEVGDLLALERDPDRFLSRVMDLVFAVLPADRGCLLMVDADGNARPRVTRLSERAAEGDVQVSRTILSKVLGGVSILTADAGADARLAQGASIVAQNIRSAICVPIRGRRKSLGAIYVDTVLSIGVFGKDDLEMLSTVGVLAGTALENIQLFRQNVQQERMAAIGKVIAGLGHDIRNMLMALRGGMYILDETIKGHADPDVRSSWSIVRHGHESIANLVQDMVNYSKPRDPDWRLTDVNQVALTAVAYAREQARQKQIQITELVDQTLEPFWLDPQAIERCMLNLLSNAVDAAPAGEGVVSVATQVDDTRHVVRIVVQDNGEGIPPENREKVFDLLFSTKGSRGTGFGLAITRKIVEEHGGRVGLRSEVGQGSTFTIELPLRTERPALVGAT